MRSQYIQTLMDSAASIIFVVALITCGMAAPAAAQPTQEFAIRNDSYACREATQMNLWDLSSGSPLIRHEMVQKNYCWKVMSGLKVFLIERVGKFARVQFPTGAPAFFTYNSNIRTWKQADSQPPPSTPGVFRSITGLYRVENASEYGVELIRKKPTVAIIVLAGSNLQLGFTVVKEVIRTGYTNRITNQRDSAFRAGGYLGKRPLGLGDGIDYAQIRFLLVDTKKRLAEIELEGHWDLPGTNGVTLRPGRVKISGKQFDDLVRPHTASELSKVIE